MTRTQNNIFQFFFFLENLPPPSPFPNFILRPWTTSRIMHARNQSDILNFIQFKCREKLYNYICNFICHNIFIIVGIPGYPILSM